MADIFDKDPSSKMDERTRLIASNPCGLCRAVGSPPPCKGHGGGSGGGSGSGSGSSDTETKTMSSSSWSKSTSPGAALSMSTDVKAEWLQTLSNDKTINYETTLLLVESDRLRGNLTFQIKPGLSKDEITSAREYFKLVKTEFEDFKRDLAEHGISAKDFKIDAKDNVLTINIPHPKYYDEFIKRLEGKNLLPIPLNIATESVSTSKHSTPFDSINTGPKPKGWEEK